MHSLRTIFIIMTLIINGFIVNSAFAAEKVRDIASEEANRKLVIDFYNKVFNEHDVINGAQTLVDEYKQHNPNVPDGKAPFVNYFVEYFKQNPESRVNIIRSAVAGDLVWIHIHARKNKEDRGTAIVDIFRVKDGKIVEHWDVIQPVPENSANQNTMF